jgi:ABC-type transport system involved in cytochrome bd biosynthesis fused ATPase/permease subunit
MELVKESFHYANNIKNFRILIFLIIINDFILDLASAELMYRVAKGSIDLIPYLILLKIIMPNIDGMIIAKMIRRIANQTSIKFQKHAFEKYDKLSFNSKNKAPASLFSEKLNGISYAIEMVIDWGLTTSFGLIGTFISSLWTFMRMELMMELGIITIVNIIIYFFVIRNKQNSFTKTQKELKKENDVTRSRMTISLPGFQYKEISPDYMSRLTTILSNNYIKIGEHYLQIMNYTLIANQFGMLFIGYMTKNNLADFMLIIMVLGNMTGAINSITQFFNQFNRMKNDYESYTEFWDELAFVKEPDKLVVPDEMRIIKVDIEKGNFQLKFDKNLNGIDFGLGSKILVRGKTGHGKTSLLEGLTGKIDGVTLTTGKPENYYHTTADMYQNIREKLPSSHITIRHFFKEEENNELIMICLQLCFEKDELTKLLTALEGKKDSKKGEIKISILHSFDCEIQEILSGGQKSRLCLATRIYEMKKNDKSILILDEPEQGSDPETIIWVLKNIFKEFDGKTIVLVSHMCQCQISSLGIKWSNQLEVTNGLISEKAFV